MIVARVDEKLLVVMEPGNIDNIQIGKPLVIQLTEYFPELKVPVEVAVTYTPDIVWVINEVKKGRSLIDVLAKSLERREIHSRTVHEPESVKNVKL